MYGGERKWKREEEDKEYKHFLDFVYAMNASFQYTLQALVT